MIKNAFNINLTKAMKWEINLIQGRFQAIGTVEVDKDLIFEAGVPISNGEVGNHKRNGTEPELIKINGIHCKLGH